MDKVIIEKALVEREKLKQTLTMAVLRIIKEQGYTCMSEETWDNFCKEFKSKHCKTVKPSLIYTDKENNKIDVLKDVNFATAEVLFGKDTSK